MIHEYSWTNNNYGLFCLTLLCYILIRDRLIERSLQFRNPKHGHAHRTTGIIYYFPPVIKTCSLARWHCERIAEFAWSSRLANITGGKELLACKTPNSTYYLSDWRPVCRECDPCVAKTQFWRGHENLPPADRLAWLIISLVFAFWSLRTARCVASTQIDKDKIKKYLATPLWCQFR